MEHVSRRMRIGLSMLKFGWIGLLAVAAAQFPLVVYCGIKTCLVESWAGTGAAVTALASVPCIISGFIGQWLVKR